MTASRVLAALIDIVERDGRATVRSLAAEVDLQLNTVHSHLYSLKRAGLVHWEEGTAGTLRPLVARLDAWMSPAINPGVDQLDPRALLDHWDELANTGAATGPSVIDRSEP